MNNEITDSSYNSILNLREITLYLNGNIEKGKIPYLNKQVICNFPNSNEVVMDIKLLTVFLKPVIRSGSLFRINLLGGNIFNYPFLKELINIFKPLEVEIQICFYLNITDIEKEHEKLNLLLQFPNSKFIFNLENSSCLEFIDVLKQYLPADKVEYNCIVECIDDVNRFQKLEDNNFNINYLPAFNGLNLEFFKKNVFTDIEDIMSLIPNQNEVFNNIKMNSKNYGKITIFNNGDIYANMNHEILGNISKISVTEIISKEFHSGNSWFLTRDKVNPCKNCVYNILCPPISNYEHVLNKFNLCNIQ